MNKLSRILTELVGTFLLTFVLGYSGKAADVAVMLTVLVYLGWHISGAHYNPAVTLAVLVRGKIRFLTACAYFVAQLAGAMLGALLIYVIKEEAFAPTPGYAASVADVLIAEVMITSVLVLVFLQTTINHKAIPNSYYGLAIGGSMFVGISMFADVSGGIFNPAAGLGLILLKSFLQEGAIADAWYYTLGPVLGSLLATIVYGFQSPDEISPSLSP